MCYRNHRVKEAGHEFGHWTNSINLGGEMNTSLYRKKPIHGAVKQCTYPSAPVATR